MGYRQRMQDGESEKTKERQTAGHRTVRKRRRGWILLLILILSLLAAAYVLYRGYFDRVYAQLEVEIGTEITAADFIKLDRFEGNFAEDTEPVDTSALGTYEVSIRSGWFTYHSILKVVDTVAPTGEVQDLTAPFGTLVRAREYVVWSEDATEVKASYEEVPDFWMSGKHPVTIVLTDAGGNETRLSAVLEVLPEDMEAPVISGVSDLMVEVGGSISYKRNITVTDNSDEEVKLTVDSSEVNLNEPGTYTIYYTATDHTGNSTTVPAHVTVILPHSGNVTEEQVNTLADQVLSGILTADMSPYDQAYAIYRYVHDTIAYTDSSTAADWLEGAYCGMVEKKGDCYVYAMTAKCLLTRAGINNMDIEKIPSNSSHYWNLIDIGEGWYHFDATKRMDGTEFFYWTDAQLMEYSDANGGTHNYDKSKYPAIE